MLMLKMLTFKKQTNKQTNKKKIKTKNNTWQLFIMNANWLFLSGMTQNRQKAIFIVVPQAEQVPKVQK